MAEYVRIRIEEYSQMKDDLKSLTALVKHERARADKYEAAAGRSDDMADKIIELATALEAERLRADVAEERVRRLIDDEWGA